MKSLSVTILGMLLISYVFIQISCDKPHDLPPPKNNTPVTPVCIDHIKGKTFSAYSVDTQTFDTSGMIPLFNKAGFIIDSTDTTYFTWFSLTINADGTKIHKTKTGGISFPERDLQIIDNYFTAGDDVSILETCTDSTLILMSLELGPVPNSERKIWMHFIKM